MIYLELFLSFFKIGLFSFGGGYAMIPLIKDICLSNEWLIEETIIDFIAVSESTPGPIAVNMATLVGSFKSGFLGAISTTLGVILPSFIITLIISKNSKKIFKNKYVKSFLCGIKPCIVSLIFSTALLLAFNLLIGFEYIDDNIIINYEYLVIFVFLIIIHLFSKRIINIEIPPIIMIIISGILGIIINVI